MSRIAPFLLSIVLTSAATAAIATPKSSDAPAQFIREICENKSDQLRYGVCLGQMGTLMTVGPFLNRAERFCPPPELNAGHIRARVLEYYAANPQLMQQSAVFTALAGLRETWPCK